MERRGERGGLETMHPVSVSSSQRYSGHKTKNSIVHDHVAMSSAAHVLTRIGE